MQGFTRLCAPLLGVILLACAVRPETAAAGGAALGLDAAESRLAAQFASKAIAYPPLRAALIALKAEARLELWADAGSGWAFVRSYLVRAASGRLGPKLRQGDHQVPEGVYRVTALNPNSRYHLSLHLGYPNAFDQARGREDGRSSLGGDIMIHGENVSDGCLPVGNAEVEEIFALATRVGVEDLSVIISPLDLRRMDASAAAAGVAERPPWLADLYAGIARALGEFDLGASDGAGAADRARAAALRSQRASCEPFDARDCTDRCARGDLASCGRAGFLHGEGQGVPRDPARAWALSERACSGGDAFGCAVLSQLVLADEGSRRDAVRASLLATGACEAGDGHGCQALARLCIDRLVYSSDAEACSAARVQRLRERAVASLRSDCKGWAALDCRTLAEIYQPGDRSHALRFARGACEGGDAVGCLDLGVLYERGGDLDRAAAALDRACAGGVARACERREEARGRTIAAR